MAARRTSALFRGGDLTGRGGRLWLQDHGQAVWSRGRRLRAIPAEERLERSDFKPMPMTEAARKIQRERVEQLLKAKKK